MSKCIRYQDPTVCDYLASQYVAGDMTLRVRARTESLARSIPELSNAISQWADNLTPLQQALYEASPQYHTQTNCAHMWPFIEQRVAQLTISKNSPIANKSKPTHQNIFYQLWNALLLWRVMTGVTTLASAFMVGVLLLAVPDPLPTTGPSYLAAMSPHGSTDQSADFVISVYAKNATSSSKLHIQWAKEQQITSQAPLHLWAENKETGAIEYIGIQDLSVGSVPLTKSSWMAIASSSRLFMTDKKSLPNEENTIFSGVCLQLQQWQS